MCTHVSPVMLGVRVHVNYTRIFIIKIFLKFINIHKFFIIVIET